VNLTDRMIAANKLERKTGVYIFEIEPDIPVQNSELRTGDIIVAFNNKPVSSVDDLHKLLNEEVIGQRIALSVLRDGRKKEIGVIPGEMKGRQQ